ncbi:MAG: leucine dehydrogenase [Bdellovibrionales bacterium CG10_big_fil_rev_8_21_14_0_10_45_34]|nr:MAG: leucine dehydrogenase [Bdellovibrionales bacterium CG10_big_fil_rev_8_21_14_0_10_45_34]
MENFEIIEEQGSHEQVLFCYNKDVGLRAIIAIHNTALGPALGGTRMWNYASDKEALIDVLRLSRGMTYKAAAAGLNLGGGKAVIIGDPRKQKTEALFRCFGQYVNSLNGRYITAEDVGTSVSDMEHVYAETPWVTGIPEDLGGSGDPSPFTAHGVLMGIKASVSKKLGTDSLKGLRVLVQGLGNVGLNLVSYLHKEKAVITVSDIDIDKVKRTEEQFGVKSVAPDDIVAQEAEVFAPCALGSVINDQTIDKLKVKIVAGGANNQLAEDRHGGLLKEMGILYAPDFVINAGGLMNVFVELEGYSKERAKAHTLKIYDNVMNCLDISEKENIPTQTAAYRLAERRIEVIGRLKQKHSGLAQRVFGSLKVDGR